MQLLRETISMVLHEQVSKQQMMKTIVLLRNTVAVAERYVNSIVAQKRDKKAAGELKEHMQQLLGAVRFLLNYRVGFAEEYALAAKYAQMLTNKSGFWNTPKFLNVDQHTDELKSFLEQFKSHAQRAVILASRELKK